MYLFEYNKFFGNMKISNPQIIELPKFTDPRGNLSFLENDNQIPSKVARSNWIYDVPGGEIRGGHAFKEDIETNIPVKGEKESNIIIKYEIDANICVGYGNNHVIIHGINPKLLLSNVVNK